MVSIDSSNPILYYKLDPGEWGSSAPASAATSVSRVSSHESSNIERFENKAAKEGCYVIAKDLYLNFNKRGDYLAATSGRSSVETYCPKKEENERVKSDLSSKISSKLKKYIYDELNVKMLLKDSKNATVKSIYESDLKKIEARKMELEQKKFRLYTQVTLLLAQHLNVNPDIINLTV